MARRTRAKRKTRRPKTISILHGGEALVQANILTEAFLGTSALGFVFDKPEVAGVSLPDIIQNPGKLQDKLEMTVNASNVFETAMKSALTSITFRFMKRALRRPVGQFNRQIMSPLALGVKL